MQDFKIVRFSLAKYILCVLSRASVPWLQESCCFYVNSLFDFQSMQYIASRAFNDPSEFLHLTTYTCFKNSFKKKNWV